MKRLSQAQRQRNVRLRWRQRKLFMKRRGLKRRVKRVGSRVNLQKKLKAPKVLTLLDGSQNGSVIKFIRQIYSIVLENKSQVLLDFTETDKVTSDAMVLIWAELHRVLHFADIYRPIAILQPESLKIQHVFKQIGLYELLKIEHETIPIEEDVIHWRAAKGLKADGSLVPGILGGVEGGLAEPLKRGLFAGITEAMTNVRHHAYEEARGDKFKHCTDTVWWMFSQYRDGNLSVVICDLGIGIPRSLPRKFENDKKSLALLAFHSTQRKYDEKAILQAMALGSSRTGHESRGYGFYRNIEPVIAKAGSGSLTVMSNSGVYCMQLDAKAGVTKRSYTLPQSILGTIICWQIPVAPNSEDLI